MSKTILLIYDSMVECTVIKVKRHLLFWKRYLVAYKVRHAAKDAHREYGYVYGHYFDYTYPATKEKVVTQTSWVKGSDLIFVEDKPAERNKTSKEGK